MELQQLKYLIAIYEEGNISKAANKLIISQPAITRSIQRLEDELGLEFFTRTKNKITFNEDGLVVVEYAKKVVKEVDEMEKGIQNYIQNKNMISIGCCAPAPLWGLYYLTKGSKRQHIVTEHTEEIIEGFYNHEFNLIVLDYPISHKDIITIPYIKEQLYLAVTKNDQFASYKEITWDQINGRALLVLDSVGYWRDICDYNLTDSKIVYEDPETYNILSEYTPLPQFRTNITIQRNKDIEDKVYIPITDSDATLSFYLHYYKKDHQFDILKDKIESIPWDQLSSAILEDD